MNFKLGLKKHPNPSATIDLIVVKQIENNKVLNESKVGHINKRYSEQINFKNNIKD